MWRWDLDTSVADAIDWRLPSLLVALGAALEGRGDPGAFFVLLCGFALAGAGARLFWDADSAGLTMKRQLGFVGVSTLSAVAVSLCLWQVVADHPGPLLGAATILALLGPRDALGIARAVLARTLRMPADGKGAE